MIKSPLPCRCSMKIKNLTVKRSSKVILKNVSLIANHGEILALIGRNGAGKTTLLNAVINHENHFGKINFFDNLGKKIFSPKIGYVPQKLLFEKSVPLTVLDLFCTNSSRLPIWLGHSKRVKNVCQNILKKVGAESYINMAISELSGGELQRVLLAFALEPIPDILLLDEPVAAVDKQGIKVFYDLITSMRKEYHMPIIIVSHDLEYVQKYADYYALIDKEIIDAEKVCNMHRSLSVKKAFGLNTDWSEKDWN